MCHETMVYESCGRRQYLAQCLRFPYVASDGLHTSREISFVEDDDSKTCLASLLTTYTATAN
jgi:hypothetical protein